MRMPREYQIENGVGPIVASVDYDEEKRAYIEANNGKGKVDDQ